MKIPETPYYLVKAGLKKEAMKALKKFRDGSEVSLFFKYILSNIPIFFDRESKLKKTGESDTWPFAVQGDQFLIVLFLQVQVKETAPLASSP